MIDDIDRQIMAILQANARTPNAEIARQVGIAPSAIFARIRKLEETGYICAFETRLDADQLGFGLVAFVSVRARERPGSLGVATRIARIPEVLEVHQVAGADCLLVKLRARDNKALGRLLREQIASIPEVFATRTTIVLDTIKETARLPMGDGLAPPPPAAPKRRRTTRKK
jgi:Lrp/AsnC family leucine-responsive transcriptional regulator